MHAFQAGEHAPAGDDHHSLAGTGEERAYLRLVPGVVEDEHQASPRHRLPVQGDVALGSGVPQLAVGHPQGAQDAEHELHRRGRLFVQSPHVHHDPAVREAVGEPARGLLRQRRLAHARRPGHRHDHRCRARAGRGALAVPRAPPRRERRQFGEPGQLPLPADEVGHALGYGLDTGRGVPVTAPGTGRPQEAFQTGPGQSEAACESGERAPSRRRTVSALQVADAPDAHSAGLGQSLDGEGGRQTQLSENGTEGRLLLCTHWFHGCHVRSTSPLSADRFQQMKWHQAALPRAG